MAPRTPWEAAAVHTPPLWFLDVDGVVNAVPPPRPGAGTWTYRTVTVAAGAEAYPITCADEVLEFLHDAHTAGRADIRWLTTWHGRARDSLAPALGLPDWPVVPRPADPRLTEHPDVRGARWWKTEAVRLVLAEEPRAYVVTDDLLRRSVRAELRALHPALPACFVVPHANPGLTAAHLGTIDDFLRRHAPPSGGPPGAPR